jgi:hypothetical protein
VCDGGNRLELWGTLWLSISLTALRVVAIYGLPLDRLEALKSLVLYLYDDSSLLHYSEICGLHYPQVYRLQSSLSCACGRRPVRSSVYMACSFLANEPALILILSGLFVAERFLCESNVSAATK